MTFEIMLLLILALLAVIISIKVVTTNHKTPSKRVTTKDNNAPSEIEAGTKTRFKKSFKITILTTLALSSLFMLAGFFIRSVPFAFFYIGCCSALLSLLFLAGAASKTTRADTGFKRFSKIAALTTFILSISFMLAGFYVPSVPPFFFQIGYWSTLLYILFFAGAASGTSCFKKMFLLLLFLFILGSILGFPIHIIEKDYPIKKPEITEKDDKIEDKRPPYVTSFTETCLGPFNETCYFNKSASVIGIDLSEATETEKDIADKIYPTFRDALKGAESFDCDLLPSVDLIDGFTKYFDDRLIAAIEEHIHTKSTIYPGGKQGFLKELLKELLRKPEAPGTPEAAGYIATAIELGGDTAIVPADIKPLMIEYKKGFLEKPLKSKPIGFYTKSKTLQNIFRRDRFLQKEFRNILPMIRIAEVLDKDPKLQEAYNKFSQLAEKVCNPEANLKTTDLLPFKSKFGDKEKLWKTIKASPVFKKITEKGNPDPTVAFWPYSYSKESRLMAQLYRGYFPKTEIMNDLINAIKNNRVDLTPDQDSGWYDYQLHALETLLLTDKGDEAEKLLLHSKYKKRLREAFEAMLTKRRETHVKQLHIIRSIGGSIRRLPLSPELSVEPTATNFLRTARAYRFLADNLRTFFTEKELSALKIEGFDNGLLKEFDNTIQLFYGLYLITCNDMGMTPKLKPMEIASLQGLVVNPSEITDEINMLSEKISFKYQPYQEINEDGQICLIADTEGLTDDQRTAWISVWKKAKEWLNNIDSQKFLDEDVRVIAPVLSSPEKVRYWAVLGTRLLKIKTYYATPPKVARADTSEEHEIIDDDPEIVLKKESSSYSKYIKWQPKDYVIPVQVFAEVTLGPEPLTRKEFRDICDKHETKEEIIAVLQGATQNKIPGWLIILICLTATAILLILIRKLKSGKKQECGPTFCWH